MTNPLVRCEFSRMVPIDAVSPHPQNPNKHPAAQIKLFAKILEHQGWRRAVVVSNRSGFIVAGHGAWESARLLGATEVPVDYQDFATEEDEIAHLLADNELAQLSERNKGIVSDLLKDLDKKDFDLELTGILETLKEPTRLEPLTYRKPAAMTYVLIAVPTVKFGEIAEAIEAISSKPETRVETTVCEK